MSVRSTLRRRHGAQRDQAQPEHVALTVRVEAHEATGGHGGQQTVRRALVHAEAPAELGHAEAAGRIRQGL